MFNLQARPAQTSPRALIFQQALAAAFKAHRLNVPRIPQKMPALLDATTRPGFPSLVGPPPDYREALCQIRASVFHAPGRDAEAQTRCHEAVATAIFAARLAQLRGASIATVFLASLLHRSGELLALRILARVELEHRIKLDTASCLAWCSSHNDELTRRLVQAWDLSPEVASCALGWAAYCESSDPPRENAALYFGRLFATELLQPEFCVPGALDYAAGDAGLNDADLAKVRAESARARELIRMLDQVPRPAANAAF